MLDKKMKKIEDEQNFARPGQKDHPDFTQYPSLVEGVRYDALNSYCQHIVFAILMREKKAANSSNASMYISILKYINDNLIKQIITIGTAKNIKIGMFVEGLLKSADKVIKTINEFVDKHFGN